VIGDFERVVGELSGFFSISLLASQSGHNTCSEPLHIQRIRTTRKIKRQTYPLYSFPGGLNSHPLLKKQYLPIATATGFPCFSDGFDAG
jgi:hypothetical protein